MKVILTGEFMQETNRYAKGLTKLENFKIRNLTYGEEAIRARYMGSKSEISAFFDVFDPRTDYRFAAPVTLSASPGPVVAQEMWELFMNELTAAIQKEPQIDGILLALHGAMATEEMEDAEGEILERLRTMVGPDVPIITTLDLHVNMTKKMVDCADALFVYDRYPHTDAYETGLRAATCMLNTLEGKQHPVMAWKKLDFILPYMPDQVPVFAPFLARAQALREEDRMINVSICHGFFASDIYEQGVAVIAVSDGDPVLAQKVADELGNDIFAARKTLRRAYYTAEEAVREALNSESFPVVLADVSDNPGSGASTDSTLLLKTMLEMKVTDAAVAVMYDPETVEQAMSAGIGSTIRIRLGGKIAPEVTGGPIECTAYVKRLTDGRFINRDKMNQGLPADFGKCALLQIDGVQVIVCSYHTQPYDLEIFRHIGIQPQDMKILMVKSAAHFRASYGKVAAKILDVEAPAQAPQNPEMLPLERSRRPIYPLDEI
ncbi:MAG: M81 family metallopeptidase [Clostridia bacterium]|nr:M81 family metallopeptidase [Clostridia bacterium]